MSIGHGKEEDGDVVTVHDISAYIEYCHHLTSSGKVASMLALGFGQNKDLNPSTMIVPEHWQDSR